MTTLSEAFKNFPELANQAIEAQVIELIGDDLYQRILAEGGEIIADIENDKYEIVGCSEALDKEVRQKIAELLSK